jgi:hypothetical protein
MSDIISDLASKCGISPELAQKGLGAVLSLFQSKLPEESFSRLSGAIPNADNMMAAAEKCQESCEQETGQESCGQESSGSVLSAIGGVASKLFGGGPTSELLSKFTQLGFSADQVAAFVPNVLGVLKDRLPGDLVKKVDSLLPQPEEAVH